MEACQHVPFTCFPFPIFNSCQKCAFHIPKRCIFACLMYKVGLLLCVNWKEEKKTGCVTCHIQRDLEEKFLVDFYIWLQLLAGCWVVECWNMCIHITNGNCDVRRWQLFCFPRLSTLCICVVRAFVHNLYIFVCIQKTEKRESLIPENWELI